MDMSKEDDLLKPLFRRMPLSQVNHGFTRRVMDEILTEPLIEPAEKRKYLNWWWFPAGALFILASYFSGVMPDVGYTLAPYFADVFTAVSGYLYDLYRLLISSIGLLHGSMVFPAIVSGIAIILAGDRVFGRGLKRV